MSCERSGRGSLALGEFRGGLHAEARLMKVGLGVGVELAGNLLASQRIILRRVAAGVKCEHGAMPPQHRGNEERVSRRGERLLRHAAWRLTGRECADPHPQSTTLGGQETNEEALVPDPKG